MDGSMPPKTMMTEQEITDLVEFDHLFELVRVCDNCKRQRMEHVDNIKCLFAPTEFYSYRDIKEKRVRQQSR